MTDEQRADVAKLVDWAKGMPGDRRAAALLALADRVGVLEAENRRLASLVPALSLCVHPQESYIVVPRGLPGHLGRMGLPVSGSWVDVRRVIVGSCAGSVVVPGSESHSMRFAVRTQVHNVPVAYLCEVVPGSPSGRQAQTVILRGALRPAELRLNDGRLYEGVEPVSGDDVHEQSGSDEGRDWSQADAGSSGGRARRG
jgi:hypothetical protein